MSAVESAAEPEDESAQRCLEAALEGIAKATSFYDFENRKFQQWPRTAAIFAELAHGYEPEAVVEEHKAGSRRRGL